MFALAFGFVFYGNGAAFIESFVNYPSWSLVGSTEFTTYHRFIGPRVLAFLVAPALLGTVLTVALLRFRPPELSARAVWVAIVLQLIMWISTATIQIPIQIELGSQGFSDPLVERLMETNFWLRRVPYGACAALFLWMATRCIKGREREG